jgi:hypothetical protein
MRVHVSHMVGECLLKEMHLIAFDLEGLIRITKRLAFSAEDLI